MVVNISKTAIQKLSQIALSHNKKQILFSVKGGGCNGFNYLLEPMDEEADKKDEKISYPDFDLIVCHRSLLHLFGVNVDWKQTIMGEGFQFENPNAKSMCGCGTSFSSKNV